ncbi:single-stranded-DNA-specific exonuclease [Bacillus phage vB_BanS_Skywalker]|uniref:Single-stranded-DNA-specific exonuclease n=2 Tax=Tsamsavirus TaxID=3044849 RepID=A0AAE9CE23_9CAUD|nr:single-stranded-DNA-specific exonuclease [Bacillus phage vB_BanS_Skywalker]YP_010680976.1 RecJ-type single-stranded DNA-specific protein [Bacillus phage vB_BanS_MrDarsey]UGO47912.1 RecJ-type single-stranded DNA-specific protein [Bacillus phage vB_BanS_MrDarsey]UGO51345.1 single-stranded-DNA-specific exonuclease [Bacillus phage vB_BanS_Skywalker]
MAKWIQRKTKVALKKRDEIEDKIAKIRGIKDLDEFLNPSADVLHDPYLMKNIDEASNRIILALSQQKNICVSFDPDADGLTSASTMIRYLRNYTDKVTFIYGERNDGHGINEMIELDTDDEKRLARNTENLELIKECDLLILIDSSSNDTKACKYISEELGKEIIILDHHEIERPNPHVLLVNPQQKGCEYPNKFLSGAGVVLKVMQVMEDTLDQVDPFDYIDLIAVGMYADIMRIDIPENRYIILQGLRNVKTMGLTRILKGAKINNWNLDCNAIGFGIAPLLNGTARMDELRLAIDLLLEDDDNKCKPLRLKMQKLNEKRKEIQKDLFESYSKKVNLDEKLLIVLDDKSSKGFNGVVAQQLSDTYKRPVIVGRNHKGTISGSFRGYGKLKLKSFLGGFSEIADIEVLGHEGAGGIVMPSENLELLQEYINKFLPEMDEKEQTVIYDLEFTPEEAIENIKVIEKFNRLTGNGFPKIIVRVNNITIDEVSCIGKTMETVKFKTFDEMELIKFRVNDQYGSNVRCWDSIDVVGVLSMNEFRNFKLKTTIYTPQVMIEDFIKHE